MEYVDIFDENNNSLNYCVSRKKAHDKKLWHRHVSCWIMNEKGQVLMQQRALTKKKNPGMWAKTGGHVECGETPDEAISREVYEEIGLKVDKKDIKNIEIFKSSNSNENYFSYGYIFFTRYKENDFILQKEEVNSVKYYSIEQLEQFRQSNDPNFTFNKWNDEGFLKQINLLKTYRDKIIKK